MPQRLEDALRRRAAALKLPPERRDAYVHGTIARLERERKEKAAAPRG